MPLPLVSIIVQPFAAGKAHDHGCAVPVCLELILCLRGGTVGGVLLIACFPLLYFTLRESPVRPTLIIDEVMNVKELDQHPPTLVYDLWVQLRDTPIDAEELPVMLAYEDQLEEHSRWYWLIGAVGTVGFALVLAGIFWPAARRAPTVNA